MPVWTLPFLDLSKSAVCHMLGALLIKLTGVCGTYPPTELAEAETPGLVWHSAAPFMSKHGERCSVSGGLFVLAPSADEFARAKQHLASMYGTNTKFRYDGSDQEFWRSFYSNPYELPIRFHATNYLKMPTTEWKQVRAVHFISGFKNFDGRLPGFVRNYMKYHK